PVDARFESVAPPDGEVITALEDRTEERDALDVIPVCMRKEDVALDGRAVRAVQQRATQLPHPRPRIQDDQPALVRAHFHAWRVAAIAHGLRARARDGSASSPE